MSNSLRVMPLGVTLGNVVGLVEVVVLFGGRVDVARISHELRMEVDQILPALNAAELLGFITVDSGDAVLTDTGTHLSRSLAPGKKKLLREELPKIEPFKTAIELAHRSPEGFGAETLAEELSKRPDTAELSQDVEKLHQMLLDWLAYCELLDYDGEDRRFHKKRRRPKTETS